MHLKPEDVYKDLWTIRQRSPLVHNITNYVVMNTTANALLSLGASPVMAHAGEEVAEIAGVASALVINIGTLSPAWISAMFTAAKTAREKGIPIILDPVGAGATGFRTDTARDLIRETPPDIIRGNGSEIMALSLAEVATKGVDSTSDSDSALESARNLNLVFNCVVCVTGATDYIVEGEKSIRVNNGHPLMPKVTGLGCTASAVCGAFAAVNPEFSSAAAHAMAVMGIAGEIAAEQANGPGTLQLHFLDALYNLSEKDIQSRLKN